MEGSAATLIQLPKGTFYRAPHLVTCQLRLDLDAEHRFPAVLVEGNLSTSSYDPVMYGCLTASIHSTVAETTSICL